MRMPMTAPTRNAAPMPTNGPAHVTMTLPRSARMISWIGRNAKRATSVPIMNRSPWTKLGMFMTPNTRARPPAMRAHMPPVTSVLTRSEGSMKTVPIRATTEIARIVVVRFR